MPLKDRAMKKKLTPKQQKFVYKYLETGNASEAYRQSYNVENMKPDTIKVAASKVLQNYNVQEAVNKGQQKAQEAHEVTLASITKELDEARTLAIDIKQPASAISASLGKAKIHGLVVDKSQLSNDPDNPVLWNVNVNIPDADKH